MTDKELKKLSRAELLELLLFQTRETERLRAQLKAAEEALADRRLRMDRAGDLAKAVLDINGVMEAAQAAANQYLENMAAMERETKERCAQMLRDAERQAENTTGVTL